MRTFVAFMFISASGCVSFPIIATDGAVLQWDKAIVRSAQHDIPCSDVRFLNRDGQAPWIVEGCGVRVFYVWGSNAHEQRAAILMSRVSAAQDGASLKEQTPP